MASRVFTFDDFELDADAFELRRAGQPVPMEPQVFEVLALLVENAGRVVPKDEIIQAVWPSGFISDAALNSRIMAARKAVSDDGEQQRMIRTVRGRGYRFVGDVSHAGTPTAPTLERHDRSDAVPGPSPLPLQVPTTSFVGRDSELGRLAELLKRPTCRLVTIAGPGGVGKTRLANQLASRLRVAGAQVTVIGLHGVETIHDMHLAIAREMELQLTGPTVEQIAAALANHDGTLVLDNIEPLLPDAAASLSRLVTETATLRVVVTSREVVGLRDEWVFPIGGLAQTAGNDGISDAERLFMEREAQAGLESDGSSDDAVRRICEQVDGMPLGLELAAALRRYLSREEIAAHIAADLGVLRSDLRDVPQRHRSVPGLLDESLRRLDPDALDALLAMSVFEGSFALASAHRVAGAPLPVVRGLVDRSLLQTTGGAYSLHPLLRQLARERLGPLRHSIEQVHAGHYADFMDRCRIPLESADQVATVASIDAEFRDVVAALRWASRNARLDLIERLAYPLSHYAQVRGRLLDIAEAIDQAVAAAEHAGEPSWRLLALLLTIRTWLDIRTARSPRLLSDARRATMLYHDHEGLPPSGFGTDPAELEAMLHWGAGRYEGLMDAAARAETRAVERGDAASLASALWLGAVARDRLAPVVWEPDGVRHGQYIPANTIAESALREAADQLVRSDGLIADGEHWFTATLHIERAVNAKALGVATAAIAFGQKAVELRRALRDQRGIVDALIRLGDSYLDFEQPDAARVVLAEAQGFVHRLGDINTLTEYERAMGFLYFVEGDLDRALEMFVSAVSTSQQAGSANNVLSSLQGIGEILAIRGQSEFANEIQAFVLAHPATTSFSKARALFALESAGPAAAALPAPGMRLNDFAVYVVSALKTKAIGLSLPPREP
ncbi:MAG: winged helix-turn-helix domain-containing protein [Dehalococcoidia bacterium]|nr:helix-turn-helix transcriptional regulator [Thermoflexaceae bacterium]